MAEQIALSLREIQDFMQFKKDNNNKKQKTNWEQIE